MALSLDGEGSEYVAMALELSVLIVRLFGCCGGRMTGLLANGGRPGLKTNDMDGGPPRCGVGSRGGVLLFHDMEGGISWLSLVKDDATEDAA